MPRPKDANTLPTWAFVGAWNSSLAIPEGSDEGPFKGPDPIPTACPVKDRHSVVSFVMANVILAAKPAPHRILGNANIESASSIQTNRQIATLRNEKSQVASIHRGAARTVGLNKC